MSIADIDPAPWAAWVAIVTPALLVLVALWRYEKRLTRRLDAQDAETSAIRRDLKVQFGGNGGGMREAINRQGQTLEDVSDRLDAHIAQHVGRSFGR